MKSHVMNYVESPPRKWAKYSPDAPILAELASLGISYAVIAKRLGKSEDTIRTWYSGKATPSVRDIIPLMKVLALAIDSWYALMEDQTLERGLRAKIRKHKATVRYCEQRLNLFVDVFEKGKQ
jgi:transcriptional regulator with XRE-family HTH domain